MKPATGWDNLWQNEEIVQRWSEFPPLPEVVALADRLAASGGRRILDIGCGTGRHVLYLAGRGFAVTGTDNSPKAVSICRNRLTENGLESDIIEQDMVDMEFGERSFEGAISTHVIHHVTYATLKKIIDQITRYLAPGGYSAWTTPTPRHHDWGRGTEIEPGTWVDPELEGGIPHHYCTEEEVRALLQAYEIESLEPREMRGASPAKPGATQAEESRWHWYVLARKNC
jgi:cyclopropane fatty-acyl-phospholipid synthase-like methyltransferase